MNNIGKLTIIALIALLSAFAFAACRGEKPDFPPDFPAVSYEVSFESNGGTAIEKLTGLANGSKIARPADPVKEGFAFEGWFKEAGLSNAWDFSADTVTANIILYAKWADKDENGGGSDNGGGENPEHTHAFGAWAVTTPPTETADGVETRTCPCGEAETRPGTPALGTAGLAFAFVAGSSTELSVSRGNTAAANIVIPAVHNGWPVTEIAEKGFVDYGALENVTIPSGITNIRDSAFNGCNKLADVKIPDSVTQIGIFAFNETAIMHKTPANGVVYADKWAVGHNGARADIRGDYAIKEGTVGICDSIFFNCVNLTNVTIPDGVKYIGRSAFSSCRSLNNITLPESVIVIGNSAFNGCRSSAFTKVVIPEGVARIGDYAFSGCSNLSEVSLPSTLTSIGKDAFNNTPVQYNKFYVGNWLTCGWIGVNLIIEPGTVGIADGAFESVVVGPTAVALPDSLKYIGARAFFFSPSLTSLELPSGLISIGDEAFSQCWGISNFTIPKNVTHIGTAAFRYCHALANITVEAGNAAFKSVGGILFSYDGTELIRCPELKSGAYTVPDGVTKIADNAFECCKALTSLTLPASVAGIGNYAFAECNELVNFTIPGGVKNVGAQMFLDCAKLSSVTIAPGVTRIGEEAFRGCAALSSVTIPESVTSIGNGAFYGCRGLGKITLPAGIMGIGDYTFSGCSGLVNITIPSGVTSIGDYAFSNCSVLENAVLPSSLTSIGEYAFRTCTGLLSVTIPASVTSVGASAFTSSSYSVTLYAEAPAKPAGWGTFWADDRNRSVVWGCTLSADKTYVVSFVKGPDSILNAAEATDMKPPYRAGSTFGGWYGNPGFTGAPVSAVGLATAPNGTYYAKWA